MSAHCPQGRRTVIFSIRFHPDELVQARRNAATKGLQLPDLIRRKALEQPIPDIRAVAPMPSIALPEAQKALRDADAKIIDLGAKLRVLAFSRREDEAYVYQCLQAIQSDVREALARLLLRRQGS